MLLVSPGLVRPDALQGTTFSLLTGAVRLRHETGVSAPARLKILHFYGWQGGPGILSLLGSYLQFYFEPYCRKPLSSLVNSQGLACLPLLEYNRLHLPHRRDPDHRSEEWDIDVAKLTLCNPYLVLPS